MSSNSLTNAKEEFIDTTKTLKVLCAYLKLGDSGYEQSKDKHYILRPGYSETEYNKFLEDINFSYDAGYGGQNLFGYILCNKGVWFDRGEYDGSEWWERQKRPMWKDILKQFQRKKRWQMIY